MFDWVKGCLGCLVAIFLFIMAIFLLVWLALAFQPKRQAPKPPPVLPTAPRSPIPSEVYIEGKRFVPGPVQATSPGEGIVGPGGQAAGTHDTVIVGETVTVSWKTAGPRHGTWKWGVLDAARRRVAESHPMGTRTRVQTRGTITVWLSSGNAEPYTMWFRIQR